MSFEFETPPGGMESEPPGATILPPLGALEILAASSEPFVFADGDFRVRYLNPAAEARFGEGIGRLYGQLAWSVWPGTFGARAERELRRAMDDHATVRFSEIVEDDVRLELCAYPAAGGLAVFVRDVTEQQRVLDEAHEAATTLQQELAELDQRNLALTRSNASLTYARQNAERTRERLSMVLDGLDDVVAWLDAQWRWTYLNDAGRLLLARLGRPGDPIGRNVWDTLPQLVGTRFESEARRAVTDHRLVEFEEFLPDVGQWLEVRVVALPDGSVLSLTRDVTDRRRRLEALQRSEERARTLLEATSHMVWVADAAGRVEDIPFWRELTGQSVEELRGSGWTKAIHPDDVSRTVEAFRSASARRSSYEAQYRIRLRDGTYRWYRARAVPLLDADGTIREWVGLSSEVDRMVRRDEGMRFLAEASAALSESLDERATLDTLARLAIEGLADGAMITLVRPDGGFEHVATKSRDGTTGAYAAETERMYPLPADAVSGYPRAIRTGEPELVPAEAFSEMILPQIAADATHLERLRHLDMYSGMVVPLVARGSILGAITLVLHGPERRRPFDAGDLSLATELGRRAALALDNARLFDAERRARTEAAQAADRLQAIVDATQAFAESAMDPVRICDALAGVLVRRSADACVVRLLDPDDASLPAVATRHRDAAGQAEYAAAARSSPHRLAGGFTPELLEPGSFIMRSGAQLVQDTDSIAPVFRELVAERGIHSMIGVALWSHDRVVGAVYLAREGTSLPFVAADVALVQDLADRAGVLLERARLFAGERAARAEAERAVDLTRRLQEITASFARTITVNEVAATTLSHGLDALSASAGLVYLTADDGRALELVRREGIPDDLLRPFQHVPLDVASPIPVADAMRSGEIVLLGTPAAMAERYPEIAPAAARRGPLAWAAVPLLHGGRALGAIALGFADERTFSPRDEALLDALGRHCAQAMERARLLDAERDARDDAERANQAKSDLLAKVSHETRQPVHASIGWVDTLEMELQGPITAQQREALRRVKQNQLRLLSVLNDLLDMSRIEAGRLDLALRDVVVADVVDAVESAVAPQMQAKGIRFEFHRPGHDVRVRADVDQLIGILTNLLGNASKFTPEGGEVVVTCEALESQVLIAVRDTGIGIPRELADRVFEPFFQVESGFTRTTVGTGLGLAISRETARAMGGDVSVESEVGKGSCFTVRLERAPA